MILCRLFLVSFPFFSCFDTGEAEKNYDSRSKAIEILTKVWNKSNTKNWPLLHKIKFEKYTHLFDSLGNVEMELQEQHRYYFHPKKLIDISWLNTDGINQIVEKEGMLSMYLDGQQKDIVSDDNIMYKIRSAEYSFLLPHVLLDTSKIDFAFNGTSRLSDGRSVYVIEAIYPDDIDSQALNQDVWWHLISTEDYSYVGYRVKHQDHISEVIDRKSLRIEGFWFPAERTSHRIDRDGKIQYLRAKYLFTNYRIYYIKENR